eukprot:TRINITY_DN9446_c0_g1_i1.p1 TRINITY_DN9446_c0_g1~~TRINITY_DN9446_c0_g1_i1.p1  ORF type:complete len:297 (+),score=27.42 TRINITY_DN9446_c0_g1_i1:87-977(+)
MVSHTLLVLLSISSICFSWPVPLPAGGRMAVHGWLILPWEQPNPKNSDPISAWMVHHTPEFWVDSPHNFQIILGATLTPVNGTNLSLLPVPPMTNMVTNEFTFTPPPPFSLNDLLVGQLTTLYGKVFNGSFDTMYPRITIALGQLDITSMPTATYLNISSAIPNYPVMRYLSYPRNPSVSLSGKQDYYLSHEIHSAPDFDQVVHITLDLDSCTQMDQSSAEAIHLPGTSWIINGLKNDISLRLKADDVISATLVSSPDVTCKGIVLEEIHCVVGPGFSDRCDGQIPPGLTNVHFRR